MRAKANLLANNLRNRLAEKPDGRYRFITLTIRHSEDPLTEQLRHLYDSFKRLRASKLWRRTQRGGAAMLEVKWSEETRRWHPHLHIVAEGDYCNKHDLSEAWHTASGDSFVADIRKLDSERDAAHYVAKYVTKGTSANVWNDRSAAQEWVVATAGLRGCTTYGTWRGFKLLQKPKDPGDWIFEGKLDEIAARAQAGSLADLYLLLALRPPGFTEERKPHRERAAPA
jgi:hypothetical protein